MDYFKNLPLPDWTSGFEARKTATTELPYEEYVGPMEQSASDSNSYKLIRLPNNMVVMCVHDADTEMSAASLSVGVGANMDPEELQGLAHFLEHMLFMGTEKYPDESEFSSFISEHNGERNAYTEFAQTTFYLDVPNGAMEEGLDRFSSFFTNPLFKKDGVDRELCAVDSEFKGLLNSDFWRLHQLSCKLSKPGHPRCKFMVGCIESLQQSAETHGLNLHEEMHKFYNQYYSSDIMKLALYGNQELDQLVEWAVQKFSGVKSKGNTVPKLPEHPVGIEQLGKCIYYETVNDIHQVVIEFPVPETKALYRYDPDIYITHLIGHESTGSLLSYLKQKGWAVGLSAGSNHNDIEGYGKLYISINATPEGLEHHADVVQAVFAYINLAASSGPQEYVFNELCTITKIGFDNRKKIDAVTWVQNYMHIIHNEYLAPEHALSKDSAFEKLDSDAIMHYLAFLNPGNYRLFIGASKHALVKCSDVELHFGTAYHVASLPASLTTELVNNCATIDELCLPAKNPFIPDDLSIKNPNMLGDQAILKPTLLKFNKDIELWFKQDDQFNTPKGSIVLEVKMPKTNGSPQAHAMSTVWSVMLNSKLNEDLYDAECAGLNFRISAGSARISVIVSGFSSKLPELLATILEAIKAFRIDSTQFAIYMAKLKTSVSNCANSKPSAHCQEWLSNIALESQYHYTVLEVELARVTLAKLQAHMDSMFDTTYIKMCMVGNFDEEDALSTARDVQSILKPSSNQGYDFSGIRAYNIEPGYYLHQAQVPNDTSLNSAVMSYIYCGPLINLKDVVTLDIVKGLVHEAFFDQLRTKQQLGYVVRVCTPCFTGGEQAISLTVEGEANPAYVTLHINKFVHDMRQKLASISDEQFDNRVASQVNILEERMKNVDEEAGTYYAFISTGSYDFARYGKKVACLKTLVKSNLLEFWDKHINPSTAPDYKRLDSQMWSSKIWCPTASDLATYSSKTLALYGCMRSEGNAELDIAKLDGFINAAVNERMKNPDADVGADDLVEKLKAACLSESGAAYIPGESAEVSAHTRTALQLAINEQDAFFNYELKCQSDFTNIGMAKTPDGVWMLNDGAKFKATQRLHRVNAPVESLVPKYKD